MDFRQMRYIVEVAECRSVSRAADNLHVSQSAVSHYVRHAEETLGVKLFDRKAAPLALTYAGMCYVESARKILAENDRLTRELRSITGYTRKLIRIGTSRDRASYMLPKILPGFIAKYPDVKIEIHTDSGQNLREGLQKGRTDILLLPDDGKELARNINTQVIYTEPLLLVIPEGFRLSRPVNPSELDGMPFFMQFRAHTTRSFCDAYFRKHNITPQILAEFPSNITCYRMASAGLGLAVIPAMITNIAKLEGNTELLPVGHTWNVLAYWRKDSFMGESERYLLDNARSVLQIQNAAL
ncbi:MAG: LysR family transcriptional regulator [Synergistaceae bacterium]|nr:LysR family transcriptional regulator [Synergistaceae bacterium]